MAVCGETPVVPLLNNTEYPDEKNLDSASSESFDLQAQEKEKEKDPDPQACSSLQLYSKTKPASKSKAKPVVNSFLPWKLLRPKSGISKIIFMVVAASTEKCTGISLQAIKKIIAATGYDLEKRKNNFKRVLRALLEKGLLRKITGRGLTGSYAVSSMMLKALKRKKKRRRRRRRTKNGALKVKKKKVSGRREGRKKKTMRQTQPDADCTQKPQEI